MVVVVRAFTNKGRLTIKTRLNAARLNDERKTAAQVSGPALTLCCVLSFEAEAVSLSFFLPFKARFRLQVRLL